MRTINLNGRNCICFSPSMMKAHQAKALAARMGAGEVRTKDEALKRFAAGGVRYVANDGREIVALDLDLNRVARYQSRP